MSLRNRRSPVVKSEFALVYPIRSCHATCSLPAAAMRFGRRSTTSTNRKYSRVSSQASLGAESVSHHIYGSKRLRSSSATAAIMRSVPMNIINIDDLPESLLAEVLCRLPSYKFVCQSKCVSNRWCTIMADPYFIHRFLCVQSDQKQQMPVMRTLINQTGEDFLCRVSPTPKVLTPLFERLMRFYRLKHEPAVLATYNDLILCCATWDYQRDYYICNPYTIQWVALPPPPQVYKDVPVGFSCDLPYYKYYCNKEDNDRKGGRYDTCIQLNTEFRYRVVRLIFPDDQISGCEFNVQIFSSETGDWQESIVSSPLGFEFANMRLLTLCHAWNGMLYWMGHRDELIGLDPFMINSSSSTTNVDEDHHHDYKCSFIRFEEMSDPEGVPISQKCLGVNLRSGCLRICNYDLDSSILYVRDLNEEDQMVSINGGAGNLSSEHRMTFHRLDEDMAPSYDEEDALVSVLPFDPNDEDIVYLQIGGKFIVKYNIQTGKWKMIGERSLKECYHFFPFVQLPWWPTPVPRLPPTCPAPAAAIPLQP